MLFGMKIFESRERKRASRDLSPLLKDEIVKGSKEIFIIT
jgi:hypothetical protein